MNEQTDEKKVARPAESAAKPRRRRRWWVSLLLTLFIFGAGMAAGGGVTVLAIARGVEYALHHPEEFPEKASGRLQKKLDLNDTQREQVEDILAERQQALQELRREVWPRVQGELDQMVEQIAEVLDAEQTEQWRKFVSDWRERWMPPPPPEE